MKRKKLKLVSMEQKPEVRDISDGSKLVWGSFFGPMQEAAQKLNAAISITQNIIAAQIIKAEGLSPEEWMFNMDNLKLERRKKEA